MTESLEQKERNLRGAFRLCFLDWEGDFTVDIEVDGWYEGWVYFSTIIEHKFLGSECWATARVDDGGSCQIEMGEDDWCDVNMGNVFALMWFLEAKPRQNND